MKTRVFCGIVMAFFMFAFSSEISAALKDYDYKLGSKRWDASWCAYDRDFHGYAVLHFRRTFDLNKVPDSFKINVSADNRYRLFVNGKSVSTGPARGDRRNWFYDTIDIAKFLRVGKNVIAAQVWNFGDDAPCAQISFRTGFILDGASNAESFLATPKQWKVKKSLAYSTTKAAGFQYCR